MKRGCLISLLIAVAIVVALNVCDLTSLFKPVPMGYYSKELHMEPDPPPGDSVDYCKYMYHTSDAFERDARYHTVTQQEIVRIYGFFDNFSQMMESGGRMAEYDFDSRCINAGDYVLIDAKDGYWNYSVYFFDVETLTLYYIHSNI